MPLRTSASASPVRLRCLPLLRAARWLTRSASSPLSGWNVDNIEDIYASAYRHRFYRGGPVLMSALSGLDIALWDIKGKKLGVPVWQLFGGKVRDQIQVYGWIGGDRPTDILEQAKKRKAQGFTTVKMNGSESLGWLASPSDLDATVERLKEVKSIGMDAGLDFHGRVHKPMAKQLARKLEPHSPLFIEEPMLPGQIEELKKLYAQTTIPIAVCLRAPGRHSSVAHRLTCHSSPPTLLAARRAPPHPPGRPALPRGRLHRHHPARHRPLCVAPPPFCSLLARRCRANVVAPPLPFIAGGITETRKIAQMAETYDVGFAPHCPLGPIAFAASLQLAACTLNFVICEMSIEMHYNVGAFDLKTYITNPDVFNVSGGMVKVLDGPGLGASALNPRGVCALR